MVRLQNQIWMHFIKDPLAFNVVVRSFSIRAKKKKENEIMLLIKTSCRPQCVLQTEALLGGFTLNHKLFTEKQ